MATVECALYEMESPPDCRLGCARATDTKGSETSPVSPVASINDAAIAPANAGDWMGFRRQMTRIYRALYVVALASDPTPKPVCFILDKSCCRMPNASRHTKPTWISNKRIPSSLRDQHKRCKKRRSLA